MSKCTRVIAIFYICLPVPASCSGLSRLKKVLALKLFDGANGGRGPVMQSVFWNTLYGSLWGAAIGVSYHFSLWSRISRINFGKYDHRGFDGLWSWPTFNNGFSFNQI